MAKTPSVQGGGLNTRTSRYWGNLGSRGPASYNQQMDWPVIDFGEWKPVPRWALGGWLAFYLLFLGYAYSAHGSGLFIDLANLVVHEGGHNLFGWFGPTLGLWGGTLLQWLVPFLLAAFFFTERQATSFAFCLFFFFENWLYTATYMADARAMQLPLVTTGDPDFVVHDWHTIFTSLGVLNYDTTIAGAVNFLGWCGMIGCVLWLAWRGTRLVRPKPVPVIPSLPVRIQPRAAQLKFEFHREQK